LEVKAMSSNIEAFQALVTLVANKATKEAIIEKGIEIKEQILKEWDQLGDDMQFLDSLIKAFAPDELFPYGWEISRTPSRRKFEHTAKATRIKAVLRIAEQIAGDKGVVTSVEIADRLVAEGDSRPRRNIMVSAGNILGKSDNWEKVAPRTYVKK
jgi:hypothetical protein